MTVTTQANGIVAVVYTTVFHLIVFRRVWPYDIAGRRKAVTLKRGRRPWE